MSLLAKIKSDSLTARKNHDSFRGTLLTTLYSEAATVGKNDGNRETTDTEVVAVVKKFVKGADETLAILNADPARNAEAIAIITQEKTILESYLPAQLSEAELQAVLVNLVDSLADRSPKQMGAVMKQLKASHEGTYDGALASKLIKGMLTG